MDETPSKKKEPRWQRILKMEALAREMDALGKANLQATDPAYWQEAQKQAADASKPAPQPPDTPPPAGGYQPGNPIKEIITVAAPIILLVWWFARDNISPMGYILIGIFACLIGLPMIIAFSRGHPQKWAIMVLCMFGGWTGILWIAALAWSLTNPHPVQVIYVNTPPPSPTHAPPANA